MDTLNSPAGFQLFCSRYSLHAPHTLGPSLLHDMQTIWYFSPFDAKLLWQSEADGSVPFPSYDLDTIDRDSITASRLWYDHYAMVLGSFQVQLTDFDRVSGGMWQNQNAEVVRYWSLKALNMHRQIDERVRRENQSRTARSSYRSPTQTEETPTSTTVVPQTLQLTDEEREYYFRFGFPYACSTCARPYRNKRGLQHHFSLSKSCNPNDENLNFKLWECPGSRVGVCDWKTSSARDMMRHLENVHGVYRLASERVAGRQ